MGSDRPVTVVRTSTANLASVVTGFERLGARVRTTIESREVEAAEYLVIPGVGSFATASNVIARSGLLHALRVRINNGQPTLAICLGMQLLSEGSEESPGARGLCVLGGVARIFESSKTGCRVPQMGWNLVEPAAGCQIIPRGYAYFANSYRLTTAPGEWLPAWSRYAGRYLAAVERGAVVGCQFHPELSGEYGKALLTRWLET